MQFFLEDMTCGGCARSVTKAIKAVDPDARVATDPLTRGVEVQTSATEEQIVTALRQAGYPPSNG
ncbi:Copper chaperone [Delftia tsuruhatensis]|uniref:heavy-metal-associated domain-containing protein n=1 Tax=Delftia tsuruhatensis TaxID=180282 RepID=UPI001E750014|nr:heavy-metal-associated domain-containing protein [Delftia tsuruhatensis]CAB5716601.1 Copper chaperone [Delftia tsuruhatensis]CAC9685918.1 Copper chaperone [Delftia tsuruhatensis]